MPTYHFICETCDECWELTQSIKKDLPKKCCKCGEAKPNRFYQDYSQYDLFFHVYTDPNTVGQQDERNKKKMGRELSQITAEEIAGPKTMAKKRTPKPWWQDGDKPLNLSTVKDVGKFIETGEKN